MSGKVFTKCNVYSIHKKSTFNNSALSKIRFFRIQNVITNLLHICIWEVNIAGQSSLKLNSTGSHATDLLQHMFIRLLTCTFVYTWLCYLLCLLVVLIWATWVNTIWKYLPRDCWMKWQLFLHCTCCRNAGEASVVVWCSKRASGGKHSLGNFLQQTRLDDCCF